VGGRATNAYSLIPLPLTLILCPMKQSLLFLTKHGIASELSLLAMTKRGERERLFSVI
jgi:hypothetical protein